MKVECQHCKTLIETVEEVAIGQHILCPACGKKFSYGVEMKHPTEKVERPIRVEIPSRNEACAAEIRALRGDVAALAKIVNEQGKRKVTVHWSLELLLILMLLVQIGSCVAMDGVKGSSDSINNSMNGLRSGLQSIYERMGQMKLY